MKENEKMGGRLRASALLRATNWLSRVHDDSASFARSAGRDWSALRSHAVFDLRGHRRESLLNIGRVLGRSLEEWNAESVSELLRGVVVHHLLGRQVALVADQQLVHVFASVTIDFLEPLLDIVEGNLVCHVVHHNDAVSSSVVAAGDRSESICSTN